MDVQTFERSDEVLPQRGAPSPQELEIEKPGRQRGHHHNRQLEHVNFAARTEEQDGYEPDKATYENQRHDVGRPRQ